EPLALEPNVDAGQWLLLLIRDAARELTGRAAPGGRGGQREQQDGANENTSSLHGAFLLIGGLCGRHRARGDGTRSRVIKRAKAECRAEGWPWHDPEPQYRLGVGVGATISRCRELTSRYSCCKRGENGPFLPLRPQKL